MYSYQIQWESPQLGYYWHHNFVHEVYQKGMLEEVTLFQEKDFIVDCNNSRYSFYLNESDLERCAKLGREFFYERKLRANWLKRVSRLQRMVNKLPWTERLSSRQLILDSISFLEPIFHEAVALHLVTQPHRVISLENELSSYLEVQVVGEPRRRKILASVLPTRLTPVMKEQIEWSGLVLFVADNLALRQECIAQHLSKWRFITAGDSCDPMTSDALYHRLAQDLKQMSTIRKHYEYLLKVKAGDVRNERNSLLMELPSEIQLLANLLRAISYIRFSTKQLWMKIWYLLEQRLRCLSEIDQTNSYRYM